MDRARRRDRGERLVETLDQVGVGLHRGVGPDPVESGESASHGSDAGTDLHHVSADGRADELGDPVVERLAAGQQFQLCRAGKVPAGVGDCTAKTGDRWAQSV